MKAKKQKQSEYYDRQVVVVDNTNEQHNIYILFRWPKSLGIRSFLAPCVMIAQSGQNFELTNLQTSNVKKGEEYMVLCFLILWNLQLAVDPLPRRYNYYFHMIFCLDIFYISTLPLEVTDNAARRNFLSWICLSVCLSVCQSVCLSVCLFVSLSVSVFQRWLRGWTS